MGSCTWGYKAHNKVSFIVALLITPLITTHEPPSRHTYPKAGDRFLLNSLGCCPPHCPQQVPRFECPQLLGLGFRVGIQLPRGGCRGSAGGCKLLRIASRSVRIWFSGLPYAGLAHSRFSDFQSSWSAYTSETVVMSIIAGITEVLGRRSSRSSRSSRR